jgi:DNA modification methylase
MAILDQIITDKYALYCGDCMEIMPQFPDESMHLSIYSPPFAGLYQYSSNERDLSNSRDYGEGKGDGLSDFPGDIIRLHESLGWTYNARYHVWKEPLGVRNRTMKKGLAHQTIVNDATKCDVASADYVLVFRRSGKNTIPVEHPVGLLDYAGSRPIPENLFQYRGWKGKQTENRYSHWIWRQYASAFWDDVRIDRVLPYKQSRDEEDEKHIHPLQLDVIERIAILWSNPGERIISPFSGVGSEPYGAVINNRFGIGCELKPSYHNQSVKNVADALDNQYSDMPLFSVAGVKAEAHVR